MERPNVGSILVITRHLFFRSPVPSRCYIVHNNFAGARYFQGRYGDLDSSCISYGPCQTPTLWFCVRRHDEIATFQPEKFYTLDVRPRRQGGPYPGNRACGNTAQDKRRKTP